MAWSKNEVWLANDFSNNIQSDHCGVVQFCRPAMCNVMQHISDLISSGLMFLPGGNGEYYVLTLCLPCVALPWGQPAWQGLGFSGLVHEETHPCGFVCLLVVCVCVGGCAYLYVCLFGTHLRNCSTDLAEHFAEGDHFVPDNESHILVAFATRQGKCGFPRSTVQASWRTETTCWWS